MPLPTVDVQAQATIDDLPHAELSPLDKSCVNSQCHWTMGNERYVHGPVAAGDCLACHTPVDEASMYDGLEHQFMLAQEGVQLCYTCHDRQDTEAVVHYPIEAGLCSDCHDDHQSPYPFRLKKMPLSELCTQCHDQDTTSENAVHGPVAAGECGACHDSHGSPNTYYLSKVGSELCFTCHTEKQDDFHDKRFSHAPAEVDCVNCHDPHTSPSRFQLHSPVPELCFGCHVDKKDHILNATTDHDALQTKKKCLNCHDTHFADFPKQLKDAPMTLCLQCHDKEQQSEDGMLMNIKQWLADNSEWHGPIRQKDCSACHNPHGSRSFRILKRDFPRRFYAPFKLEKYALCFGCHEQTIVLDRNTTTVTNFRNGDENLHFRHVNQPKGRTCRACHELHASNNPKLLRDMVPFGEWQMSHNYVKYEQGGKCSPGCHKPRGYNRANKVENPIDYDMFTAN